MNKLTTLNKISKRILYKINNINTEETRAQIQKEI